MNAIKCHYWRWIALFLIWVPLSLSAEYNLDVRVLVDVSGSMKRNDPENLRQPAVRLLTELLDKKTQAGVWIFDRHVKAIAPLQQVDDAWKSQARQGIDQIHSLGQFTHIEGAISQTTGDWYEPDPKVSRHLIILTDGMVDVSPDPSDSQASRQRIIQNLLPDLKHAGAKVHTIALSPRADRELLGKLSEETGGLHEFIEEPGRMQRLFLKLFEQASQPDAIPLKDNKFMVDTSIDEATLIIFRGENAAPTRLVDPRGKAFDYQTRPETVRWHQDKGFDLITLNRPVPGEWRVQAELDPDNRVLIVTDLKMQLAELPTIVLAGEKLPIAARFTNEGKLLVKKEFLDVVKVVAQFEEGDGAGETTLPPDDEGLYYLSLPLPDKAGRYPLVVTGRSETFVREQRHQFEVRKAVTFSKTLDETSAKVQVKVDPDLFKQPEVKAVLVTGDEDRPQLSAPIDENTYEVEVALNDFSGKGELRVQVQGQFRGKISKIDADPLLLQGTQPPSKPDPVKPPPVEEKKPEPVVTKPEPAPKVEPKPEPKPQPKVEEERKDDGLTGALLIFIGSNLVLILLGVGGWFWWRRRKTTSQESAESEDAEKDDDS